MIDTAAFARTMVQAFAGQAPPPDPATAGAPLREPWRDALRRGDHRLGWSLYDAKFARHLARGPDAYVATCWRGGPLAGRALTVLEAGGLGDAVFHSRAYAPLAARARDEGRSVAVVTARPLARLWRANFPELDVTERRFAPTDPRRLWVLAESLPGLLGATPEALPSCPYLRADADDVATRRRRLRLDPHRVNVGLCWATGQRDDDPRSWDVGRTIGLAGLAPLVRVPGVRWFGLQVGRNAQDPAPEGMELERLGPSFRDLADTAAVCSLLDLTVTVDTAVANLVGAMGLPGVVLLPHAANWRWMTGETSPWFPSLKLFRQQRPGDWAEPVARVSDELARLAAQRGAA